MASRQYVDHVDVLLKRLKANKTPGSKEIADAEQFHKENMQLLDILQTKLNKAELDTNKKHKDRDAPTALEKANKKLVSLENENTDLKLRLSTLTGQKMSGNNSNIADLSDPYRPTNLAEKFREVYDNQWTCAYEELEKLNKPEHAIIELLAKLIRISDEFCSEIAKQQLAKMVSTPLHDVINPTFTDRQNGGNYSLPSQSHDDISNDDRRNAERQLREFRKSLCHLSVKSLKSIFELCRFRQIQQEYGIHQVPGALNNFVEVSLELLWRMKVQEAPMSLVWQKPGEAYTRERFSEFTRKGSNVVQTVWPAVLLRVDGPLMSKGIVDVK